ncbi:MAG: FtsX-like permease family protein [Cytophagales bacterium]|nr:FtsX-like permease family protein [Cytophagales bacterium]
MFRNYLTTAFRNFRKNQLYLFVNIVGLSIGISCCLVVYSILKHELTFDSWHQNPDRLFRVVEHFTGDNGMDFDGVLPNPMPEAISHELASIQAIPMLGPVGVNVEFELNGQYKTFEEGYVLFADQQFLTLLDFPLLRGASAEALNEPNKVFLTEKLAKKYFGDQEPLGRTITIRESIKLDVVGILEDTPTNTSAPFDMLISYGTREAAYQDFVTNWGSYWAATCYVSIDPSQIKQVETQINTLADANLSESAAEKNTYYLQPLSEVHTDNRYGDAVNYVAPAEILIGFILLGSITLIASMLNFINLATAQAVKRAKEIGIRKTLGSLRSDLIIQFLGETLMVVIMAVVLGFTIGQFFMNKMNEFLIEESFHIEYDITTIVFAALLAIVVTILAGFYPAMVLARYSPINALRSNIALKSGSGRMWIRRGLVISQFVIANLLIVSTIIVAAQMDFIRSKDLGFSTKNVMTINFPQGMNAKMDVALQEFENASYVESVSRSRSYPHGGTWNTGFKVEGTEYVDGMHTALHFADSRFIELYDIPLIAGENIRNQYNSDTTLQILVSREFVKVSTVPMEEIIGKEVAILGSSKGKITGVMEDFHNSSLQERIRPVIIVYNPGYMNLLNVKVAGNDPTEYFGQIENKFRELSPTGHFSATLLLDSIKESYVVENLVYGIFQVFAGLAVLIGIFGLYGLVSFMSERNSKTISIRKVFGAGTTDVLWTFSRPFVWMVILAFIIASPISYLLTGEWLNEFEYQISANVTHFLIGLGITIMITAITIGYRSWRVATSNPVNALRNE